MRAFSTFGVLFLLVFPFDARAAACVGDCDGDGSVAVSEVVLAVNFALDAAEPSECRAVDADGDGFVAIDEIVTAVENVLRGCPPICGDGRAERGEECDDGGATDGDGCSARCELEPGGDPCAGVPSGPGTDLRAVLVTDAVSRPVHVAAPPLDPNRLFIVEQGGRIRVVEQGRLLAEPFLDVSSRVSCCGEQGLFSVAFHPDYETNGRFFVDYTDRGGDTVVARYRVDAADPNRADPASGEVLFTVDQPRSNHNGGQLAFGPDGFLYVGMGDGGGGGDPFENAQDDDTVLGKLLRVDIDVEGPPYHRVPEDNPNALRGLPLGLIWAKGLRNPWRFGFDRATGDLYVADVGQGTFEEIDVQPADSRGGENYGWDVFEADACFDPNPLPACPSPPDGFVFPVLAYDHGEGCSVTGGFVYRGCALPELRGTYFYADYCTAFVRSFALVDGVATAGRDWTADLTAAGAPPIRRPSSFGEDARGELYVADLDGRVYELIPASP